MKKLLLFFVVLCTTATLYAQTLTDVAARNLLSRNSNALGLSKQDMENVIVANAYHNKSAGTDMIYLQQAFKGLPVYNQLLVLAFKNGQLVSNAGARVSGMEKKTVHADISKAIAAEQAVRLALAEKKLATAQNLVGVTTGSKSPKYNFGKLGVTTEEVTAELMWVPVDEGRQVKLAWQVYIVPSTTADYWLLRFDAQTQQLISETNLTVYCDWGNHADHAGAKHPVHIAERTISNNQQQQSPSLVGSASYKVIPYPAESPIHPGGSPATVTNPWTMSPGNATSLGWHNDGAVDYTISRGNNVWAQEDRDNNNNTNGLPATSTTTPDPLTFNFTPDFTLAPTTANFQQFAITNLFYWNNLIHDFSYLYGFDEVSGNFQSNNQGRGGLGNDYVIADAQDAGGTSNANFATPADGGRGRMQMYLWSGSPQKDGDIDNGIVLHEYTHGISTRLTGGPANSGCLGNVEQMGEGWSDYFSLMLTQDWATSTITDGFTKPRGMGTYATGSVITGVGIRPARYTTNLAVNNYTYANLPSLVAPHGVGFLWCTVLWDMTWKMIEMDGINPNIFNPATVGGNSAAVKLVTEGMRLQPCSPGFIDGRNAILQADQILYNGRYRCAIMEAFARRGLGFDASQGSSNSKNDQIVGFSTVESSLQLVQNVTQQLEGQNIVYTNKVTAGSCNAITNYLVTDTLPANVTYVSGGTYNAATRVVRFVVNVPAGTTQNYSFTVSVNPGSYFTPIEHLNDAITATSIPNNFIASSSNATNWVVSSAQSHTAPSSLFGADQAAISDMSLTTSNPVTLGANPAVLSFWHHYDTEDGWDGGVVEMSTNGGANWTDLGAYMTQNKYNGALGTGSALANRAAFTGQNTGFIQTIVRLLPFTNVNAQFRFRCASDDNTASLGWFVDDVRLSTSPEVNMRSTLINTLGAIVNVSDTVAAILQNVAACVPVTITTQPSNISTCTGATANFTVATAGSTPQTYQWEVSTTGCAGPWNNVTNATSATLSLTNVTAAMNNYAYRVKVSNSCTTPAVTSACAVLTVNLVAVINSQPANQLLCAGSTANFSVTAAGTGLAYQWQVSTNGGTSFANIAGQTGTTLSFVSTSAMNNNQYRVLVTSTCSATGTTSAAATLNVYDPPVISSQPASFIGCVNANATFATTATGSNLAYQWQVSTNGGVSYSNIAGATTPSLTVTNITALMNGYLYRVLVSGNAPCANIVSATAILTVKPTPVVVLTLSPYSSLTPYTNSGLFTTISPVGTYTYQWYRNGVLLPNITTPSLPVTVDWLGEYKVVITDVTSNCTSTSNLVTVTDSASSQLFIYPNANRGQFQVRYYNQPGNSIPRSLNVFDAKGALIFTKAYNTTGQYGRMDVDIRNASAGVYFVELRDAAGKRIISGRVVKL
ncbi:MAG: type sorting protein [Ferruginibacter sp.]|nr:type sorting protein [Ferruginibacter sp.]